MKTLAIPILVAASLLSRADELTLVDRSQANSPISISGNISVTAQERRANEYELKSRIMTTNRSNKAIVLAVIEAHIVDPTRLNLHHKWQEDFFFAPKLFESRSAIHLDEAIQRFAYRSQSHESEERPAAVGRVLFVEFEDGSSWGDKKIVQTVLARRQLCWARLKSLQSTCSDSANPKACVDEIMQPSDLEPIISLQDDYRKEHSYQAVTQRLSDMLNNGRLHHDQMHQ